MLYLKFLISFYFILIVIDLSGQGDSGFIIWDNLKITYGNTGPSSCDRYTWMEPIDEFLRHADNYDISIIGELNHYDGTALMMKTEVIRKFINRYPNTILLTETGIGTAAVMDERFRSRLDSTVVPFCYELYNSFSIRGSREALAKVLSTKYQRPDTSFIYGGIDPFESYLYFELFMDTLISQVKKNKNILCKKALQASSLIQKSHRYSSLPDKKEAREYYQSTSQSVIRENIEKILSCDCLTSIQRQVLQSYEHYGTIIKQWFFNRKGKDYVRMSNANIIRDSIMAENVAWFKRQYPNHKIIISVSNFHASKTFENIHRRFNDEFKPMGYYLEKKFPGKVFSVPVIRYTGASGRWKYQDQYYKVVPEKPENSLEAKLAAKCKNAAFVDFFDLKETDRFWMHATFDDGNIYQWKKAFNGVLFLYEMSPDTQRAIGDRKNAVFPN